MVLCIHESLKLELCCGTICIQTPTFLMYAAVKSRIELNKRLHYTLVTLLVRSPLSYMQIQSLFS